MTYDSDQVTAIFEDGSKALGNMLIGCDGAKSRVRELLLGEKAKLTDAPFKMFNFTSSYTAEQALHVRSLHPIFKFGVYEGTGELFWISSKLNVDSASYFATDNCDPVQDVPEPDKPETWLFQIIIFWMDDGTPDEEDSNEWRLRLVKERAEKWVEPFRSACLWLKDDTIIPKDTLRYWAEPVKWDNHGGRITLCGDSAHPMTPRKCA
jgi:2-polyprenyl-6-methoxyphenol hydroxylase-like FAD-dependent oxidoreductase